jgi:hypothetical protein
MALHNTHRRHGNTLVLGSASIVHALSSSVCVNVCMSTDLIQSTIHPMTKKVANEPTISRSMPVIGMVRRGPVAGTVEE